MTIIVDETGIYAETPDGEYVPLRGKVRGDLVAVTSNGVEVYESAGHVELVKTIKRRKCRKDMEVSESECY